METQIKEEGVIMKMIRFIVLALSFSFLLTACGEAEGSQSKDVVENQSLVTSFDSGTGTFYYPDEDFNNYLSTEKEFNGTPQNVVEILYELGNYKETKVNVRSWYIKGNTMYIDFDSGFADACGSTAKEYFTVYGTVKTLKSCFGVEKVRLTVEGKDFNTQHGAYDLPL